MNQQEQGRKMSQLIARCWADEGFKQKLLADPAATLKAEGAEIPAGLSIKALENTDKVFHLVIPARPTALSDADLDKVVGGVKAMPVGTSSAPPVTIDPEDPNFPNHFQDSSKIDWEFEAYLDRQLTHVPR